jgi:sulfhydrogenase subunit alpha
LLARAEETVKNRSRTIRIDSLARVEGQGGVRIRLRQGLPPIVHVDIFEPPRFFEALLSGRSYLEAPDITARICGICPVAYLLTACHAMEDALGLRVTGTLRALRRLLYAGEWIESHAMHVFCLHAPDFLGYPDVVAMASEHRPWVERGLRIKKVGNTILKVLGGREIHPINVRVGGFWRLPARAELTALLPELHWARGAAAECLEWMASFSFPELERDYEFLALRHPAEYPFCEGRLASSKGVDCDAREFEGLFVEEQVPHATALRTRMVGRGACLCGPLARFNLNFERLAPGVQALAGMAGLRVPCLNPFRSLLVRLVEIAQVLEEAIRITEAYEPPGASFLRPTPRAATGHAATEAPRGLLYHRYDLAADGSIAAANIVPPTVHNQLSIEEDLEALGPQLAACDHRQAAALAEQAVRNYDPCISCATHAVTCELEH